jgi:hypothetical protein
MQTIDVSYSAVEMYRTASLLEFRFFLGLIVFLWYVNLLGELKAIVELFDFMCSFPVTDKVPLMTNRMRQFVNNRVTRSLSLEEIPVKALDPEGIVVTEISRVHQMTILIMIITRLFILVYMFHVGSSFLITQHKYDELLLNAVALAFIFELPEFLYHFLISDELKNQLDGVSTAAYTSNVLPPPSSPWAFFFAKSVWGVLIIPVIVILVVAHNDHVTTLPSLRALNCACFQEGESCEVATQFKREWWDEYWKDIAVMFRKTNPYFTYR